jgi:DNA-binding CsgD family transcriptional regulator
MLTSVMDNPRTNALFDQSYQSGASWKNADRVNITIISHNHYWVKGFFRYAEEILTPGELNDVATTDIINPLTVDDNIYVLLSHRADFGGWNYIFADSDWQQTLLLAQGHGYHSGATILNINQCGHKEIDALLKAKGHMANGSVRLSFQEQRVCYYLAHGYSLNLIGRILNVNSKTISHYRSRVMQKIGSRCKMHFNQALINYFRIYQHVI